MEWTVGCLPGIRNFVLNFAFGRYKVEIFVEAAEKGVKISVTSYKISKGS